MFIALPTALFSRFCPRKRLNLIVLKDKVKVIIRKKEDLYQKLTNHKTENYNLWQRFNVICFEAKIIAECVIQNSGNVELDCFKFHALFVT